MIAGVSVQEKITDGFENALDYRRDDFNEDGHATTIRLRTACWVCAAYKPIP
jgi:hypothetical protein